MEQRDPEPACAGQQEGEIYLGRAEEWNCRVSMSRGLWVADLPVDFFSLLFLSL
jgi:hypothetical protein